jgi:hypothetical protein
MRTLFQELHDKEELTTYTEEKGIRAVPDIRPYTGEKQGVQHLMSILDHTPTLGSFEELEGEEFLMMVQRMFAIIQTQNDLFGLLNHNNFAALGFDVFDHAHLHTYVTRH